MADRQIKILLDTLMRDEPVPDGLLDHAVREFEEARNVGTPVDGNCPMGCGETLVVTKGFIFCSKNGCPNPLATDILIRSHNVEHIVSFKEDGWYIIHPLRERLRLAMSDQTAMEVCGLNDVMHACEGPPEQGVGRYIAKVDADGVWTFTPTTEG